MNYTITAIRGDQISVEYADGTTAQIPIPADYNAEQIDCRVGEFCSEYQQQIPTNPLISVGDQRTTRDPADFISVSTPAEEATP